MLDVKVKVKVLTRVAVAEEGAELEKVRLFWLELDHGRELADGSVKCVGFDVVQCYAVVVGVGC